MAHWSGSTLVLLNECGLACRYCGYPRAEQRLADLGMVRDESARLRAVGIETVTLVSKDPVAHDQFEDLLRILLDHFTSVRIESTGIGLHAARGRTWWAYEPRIIWTLPYVSADAALHDHVVGRPGHHAIVSELMADQKLQLYLQLLLVKDVLVPGNVRGALAAAGRHGREVALRYFTPRDTSSGMGYYVRNVARATDIWQSVPAEVDPTALRGLLAINPQCYPPCALPSPLQPAHFEAFRARIRPGVEALQDASLLDLAPCPRESTCAFGDHCLGLHRSYLDAYGDAEFQPEGVDGAACAEFLSHEADAALSRQVRVDLRSLANAPARAGWSWTLSSQETSPPDRTRAVRYSLTVLPELAELSAKREIDARQVQMDRWRRESQRMSDAIDGAGPEAVSADLEWFLKEAPEEAARTIRGKLELRAKAEAQRQEEERHRAWRSRAEGLYARLDLRTVEPLQAEVAQLVASAPANLGEPIALHARRLLIMSLMSRKKWRKALEVFDRKDPARDETWKALWKEAMVGALFERAVRRRPNAPAESREALRKILEIVPDEPNALKLLEELKDRV